MTTFQCSSPDDCETRFHPAHRPLLLSTHRPLSNAQTARTHCYITSSHAFFVLTFILISSPVPISQPVFLPHLPAPRPALTPDPLSILLPSRSQHVTRQLATRIPSPPAIHALGPRLELAYLSSDLLNPTRYAKRWSCRFYAHRLIVRVFQSFRANQYPRADYKHPVQQTKTSLHRSSKLPDRLLATHAPP